MNTKTAPRINPYLVLCLGAFGVSTGAIFAKFAQAPSLAIAAYRVGLATLFLTPPGLWSMRKEKRRLSLPLLGYTLGAGVFLALHFATWIASLSYTSVASSVVLVNTIPIWTGLLAPFFLGEHVSRNTLKGIVLSVFGGAYIGMGDFSLGPSALWGDALALFGGVSAALYIMLGRKARPHLSLSLYTFLCYGSAALCLWGALFLTGTSPGPYSAQTWLMFLGMALISQMLGHSAYNWSLRWLSSSFVAVSLLGEPIGGSLLAWWLLKEPLTFHKIFGGVWILAGILLAAREERN